MDGQRQNRASSSTQPETLVSHRKQSPSSTPVVSSSNTTTMTSMTQSVGQDKHYNLPGKEGMDVTSYEALFDSGYSTGLPVSAQTSSNNIGSFPSESCIDKSSLPHLQQPHFKLGKEVESTASDSGLCIDSRHDLDSSSHLTVKTEEEGSLVSSSSTQLPTSLRLDLNKIGVEALIPNEEGYSLLHQAIVRGPGDVALALIQKAVHPDLLDVRNAVGQTPLHLAALTGQAMIVRRLLVSGATVDVKNWDGNTALHISCLTGDLESVKGILKPISPSEVIEASLDHYMPQIQGSNMISLMHDMNYEGETCLHLAAKSGNRRLLEYLKSLGANFNVREGKSGYTCLHWAVLSMRPDIVQMLTTVCRVDVNVRCYSGKTALQAAWSLAKKLQEQQSYSSNSVTVASSAIRSIIILLLESGANRHEYDSSDDYSESEDYSDEDDEEDDDEGGKQEDDMNGGQK